MEAFSLYDMTLINFMKIYGDSYYKNMISIFKAIAYQQLFIFVSQMWL